MLKRLRVLLDVMLLSALVMPMVFATNVADFVAHPFTIRGGVTHTASRSTSISRKPISSRSSKSSKSSSVLMASRSVKSPPRFPNYSWERGGGSEQPPPQQPSPSSQYQRQQAVATYDDDIPLYEDDYDYESECESSDYEDDEEFHLPSQFGNVQIPRDEDAAAVLYRYFAKSRSRLRNHDSIPFIFVGPSLDHWKEVGQTLASRGFSVMACERDEGQQNDNDAASNLVEEILDALKWNKAILVGCDREAVMAIRAALKLSPDRVAGLILCGDLTDVEQSGITKGADIDAFLQQHVKCPYSVIWDGASAKSSWFSSTSLDQNDPNNSKAEHHRCLIRGGGSAPHRRLPEQFAWALTRFVEEQVAPVRDALLPNKVQRKQFLDQLVTPGGLLVAGRVLAEAVFYVSAMKVVLYQYENIYWGMTKVYCGYKKLFSIWPRRFARVLSRTVLLPLVGSNGSRRAGSLQRDHLGDLEELEETLMTLQPEPLFHPDPLILDEEKETDPLPEKEVGEAPVVEEPPIAEEPPAVEQEEPPVVEQEEPPVEEEPEASSPPTQQKDEPMYWPIPLLNPVLV